MIEGGSIGKKILKPLAKWIFYKGENGSEMMDFVEGVLENNLLTDKVWLKGDYNALRTLARKASNPDNRDESLSEIYNSVDNYLSNVKEKLDQISNIQDSGEFLDAYENLNTDAYRAYISVLSEMEKNKMTSENKANSYNNAVTNLYQKKVKVEAKVKRELQKQQAKEAKKTVKADPSNGFSRVKE